MASSSLHGSLQETLTLFDTAGTPQTTSEIAGNLDIGRRSTYNRLDQLVEQGFLETKKVGGNGRVWWRPADETGASGPGWDGVTESLVAVLTGTDAAVFIIDEDDTVTWVNDAAVQYFGFDRETVLGQERSQVVENRLAPGIEDSGTFTELMLSPEGDYREHSEWHVTAGRDREERSLEYESEPIETGTLAGGRVEFYDEMSGQRWSNRGRYGGPKQFDQLVDVVEEYAIFVLDTEGHIQSWNDGARRIKGYEAEEIVGEHVSTFYTTDDRESGVAEQNLSTAATQGSIEDEGWRVRKDGSRFWANVTITAIYDDTGNLDGYLKVTRDMTDRREYKQSLAEQAEQLEAQRDDLETELDEMFERIDDAFYALNEEFQFEYLNDSAADHFGKPEGELLGQNIWNVLDVDDEDPIIDRFETAMTTQETLSFERYSDILGIWASVNVYPSLTGLSVYFRDISTRKKHEQQLRKSEQRYRTLVENFPNGAVTLVDENLRYITVGGHPVDEADTTTDELEGKPLQETLPSEIANFLLPNYEAALEGETQDVVHEIGEYVYQFHFIPVRDGDGDVIAAMGMSQDITEARERQRKLERQREQLVALNNLNDTVRGITDAVINQSTREEIESIVCERLAAADSYAFAWIGDVDVATQTVTLRTEAGVDGYLDDTTISVDPDDVHSLGPTGRALRTGELQTVQDVTTDASYEPWRDKAEGYDFQSSAAIPLVHDDSIYGVLNLYADRPNAFQNQERTVIRQLGEIIGHAIAAIERKRALMSDEVIELQFRIQNLFDALGIDGSAQGEITMNHTIPIGNDEFLVYGTATQDAIESVDTIVETVPHWVEVTYRDAEGKTVFELRVSDPPILSKVAAMGGSIENAVIEDCDYRMTFHVSPSADIRQIIDTVNCSGVKPRSFFPWIGRTHPTHHRSGSLQRCGGSRSGRPQAPMPAVATPISEPVGVC